MPYARVVKARTVRLNEEEQLRIDLGDTIRLRRCVQIQILEPLDVPCVLENVMGQEDRFREEEGVRVDNTQEARIVFTTIGDSTAVIHYRHYDGGGSWQEKVVDTLAPYHEVFLFELQPAATYQFFVVATCDDGTEQTSGNYYFETSNEVFRAVRPLIFVTMVTRSMISHAIPSPLMATVVEAAGEDISNEFDLSVSLTTHSLEESSFTFSGFETSVDVV